MIENEKNVMIISMSTFPDIVLKKGDIETENFYYIKEKNELVCYSGVSQLEAGTKHVIRELAKQEVARKIDRIIILATKETIKPALSEEKIRGYAKDSNENTKPKLYSAVEYYKHKINQYIMNTGVVIREYEVVSETGEECEERKAEEHQREEIDNLVNKFFKGSDETADDVNSKYRSACNGEDKQIRDLLREREYKTEPFIHELYKSETDERIDFEVVLIESPQIGLASKSMPDLVNKIKEVKGENEKVNLFIDMQGGVRASTFIVNAVINMLEEEDIVLEKAYATNYTPRDILHPIRNEILAHRIFDLVSGMDEFIQYGKAEKFKEYFDNYIKVQNKQSVIASETVENKDKSKEEEIVISITRISDAISVCDIDKFYRELQVLEKLLKPLLDDIKNAKDNSDPTLWEKVDPVFATVVEKIYQAYENVFKYCAEDADGYDSVGVMKWCLDKKLYQQALTICESKIPKQIVEDGLVEITDRGKMEAIFAYDKANRKTFSPDIETYAIKNYEYYFNGKKRPQSLFAVLSSRNKFLDSKYKEIKVFRSLIKEYFQICQLRNKINHGNCKDYKGNDITPTYLQTKIQLFIDYYDEMRKLVNKDTKENRVEMKMEASGNKDSTTQHEYHDEDANIFRYVVPFWFSEDGNIETYHTVVNKLSSSESLWKAYDWKDFEPEDVNEDAWKYGGSDIYDYIKKLYGYKMNNKNGVESTIGSIWEYKDNSNLPKYEYSYFRDDKRNARFVAKIERCGVYLLKTGIGLFWYEITFQDKSVRNLYPNQLQFFQNKFKELAKLHNKEDKGKISCFCADERNGKFDYIGMWVADTLSSLKDESNYEIYYYPSRTIKIGEGEKKTEVNIPDKAILYNYVVTNNNWNLEKNAYYLTMGYTWNYQWSSEMEHSIAHPFGNELWYASKEGCGCYAYCKNENDTFYKYLPIRMRSDYFLMFMHLLQQSYSIMHMSTYIAESISATGQNENDYKELVKIEEAINRFLLKNVNASVSHVGHHNDFYAYVEGALKIQEDIKALNEGVEVLEEILRRQEVEREEKRNKGIQTILGILTVIGFIEIPDKLSTFFHVNSEDGTVTTKLVEGLEGLLKRDITQIERVDAFYILTIVALFLFFFWKLLYSLFEFDVKWVLSLSFMQECKKRLEKVKAFLIGLYEKCHIGLILIVIGLIYLITILYKS